MSPRQPQHPTPSLVREHVAFFDRQYENVENALSKLLQTFPENWLLEDVLLKVVVVNRLYNAHIFAVEVIAQGIRNLHIDPKLASKSVDLVNEIAAIPIPGNNRRNYSFATKYCSWHVPDAYPIYDTWAERLIWSYLKEDNFAEVRREDFQDYRQFAQVMESFRSHYGLSEFTFKDLDKFLWLHSQEVFGPATVARAARVTAS